MKYRLMAWSLLAFAGGVCAQTPASVSYSPTWQARHHLQWLADNAGLPLPVTHWPLPAAAVQQALDKLAVPVPIDADVAETAEMARQFVRKELEALQSRGRIQLHVRSESEGLNGYGDNYTPGSSGQISTAEGRWAGRQVSAAGRLGARLEANANSTPGRLPGAPHESRYQFRPDGTEAVVGWGGWNMQVFSHRNWWGPGWQSSLINGHNNPAWLGAGLQRGSVQASDSDWLSWMGPWNMDVFVAKAQDPVVVELNQPKGFVYSGLRLTMKPRPWLEVGLSRGLQTGGAGRPSGIGDFVKAFLGQETNKDPDSPFQDSSNQVAGYDVRARCPQSWGSCAVYSQWIGEDSAGKYPPLPYRFMKLYGAETTYAAGRYRVFVEYANTLTTGYQATGLFPGYTNIVYTQGYTNGARWVGSAQGGGSEVTTLGWMDAEKQQQVKLHLGRVTTSIGTFAPSLTKLPHGRMWGFSASQSKRWMGMNLTPELAYTHLAEGEDQRASKRNNLRVGLVMAVPL